MTTFHRLCGCLALGVMGAVSVSAARADVTIKQHIRMEGGGAMAMMNMSGDSETTISGDRARIESNLQMESRLMRMFAGHGPSVEIVRLDQGEVYHLNPRKKTYSEMSLAEQKAQMEKSMAQMKKAQESRSQQASGVEEGDCQWSEPTATVKRTGQTDTIAGAHVERTVVTATQSCKNPKSGQVCDFNLILDQWLAPDLKASDEVNNYYRSYAKQLGLEVADAPSFSQRLESMFGGYHGIWGEIARKMATSKGYPLRSTVTLAVGGPSCKDVSAQSPSAASGAATPAVGEAVGGAAGETAGGDSRIGRAVGGALGRFFGGRRDKAAQQEQQAEQAKAESAAPASSDDVLPKDTVKMMSISSELESVSREPAAPSTFEVPSGYRKVGGA